MRGTEKQMATHAELLKAAIRLADNDGKLFEELSAPERFEYMRKVRDMMSGTIIFPLRLGATRCLMRTYSYVERGRHGVTIRHISVEAGASWGSWTK
jgi:hypothetical protein